VRITSVRWRLTGRPLTAAAAVAMACGLLAGADGPSGAGTSHAVVRDSTTVASVSSTPPPGSLTAAQEQAYALCSQIITTRVSPAPVLGPFQSAGYAAGYSNVDKLQESAMVSPALLSSGPKSGFYLEPRVDTTGECQAAVLRPDYDGQPQLPPVTATFLGFGFEPVTATVELTQAGLASPPPLIEATFAPVVGQSYTVVSTVQLALRVISAKVNGVPLDIGPNCRTVAPLYSPDPVVDPKNNLLALAGGNAPTDPQPAFTFIGDGGALAGTATIPPFTGCGADGDNLDPLITASISGQGNYLKMNAGPLCATSVVSGGCVPGTLTPLFKPLWTVQHGGTYTGTATGSVTFVPSGFALGNPTPPTITCAGASIAGTIPDVNGALRGAIATFEWTGSHGCQSQAPDGTWAWKISGVGTALLSPKEYNNPVPGVTELSFTGLGLTFNGTLSGTSDTCQAALGEPIDLQEAFLGNPGSSAEYQSSFVFGTQYTLVTNSNCPADVFPISSLSGSDPNQEHIVASFALKPDDITITTPVAEP
jgi:hypothetical protein